MAGDCGDKIPSKSKPQSAGITSCTNFENVLHVRYLQTSIFFFRLFCTAFSRKFREYSQNSSSVMVFLNFFQFFDLLPLVFASPEDLCGSFFFFLNGSSFPSASILSRICSIAAPPRYCLPEMSFTTCCVVNHFQGFRTENHLLILLLQLVHVTAYKCRKVAGGSSIQ